MSKIDTKDIKPVVMDDPDHFDCKVFLTVAVSITAKRLKGKEQSLQQIKESLEELMAEREIGDLVQPDHPILIATVCEINGVDMIGDSGIKKQIDSIVEKKELEKAKDDGNIH